MSNNAKKITKALAAKGYQPREMHWDPIFGYCPLCGKRDMGYRYSPVRREAGE